MHDTLHTVTGFNNNKRRFNGRSQVMIADDEKCRKINKLINQLRNCRQTQLHLNAIPFNIFFSCATVHSNGGNVDERSKHKTNIATNWINRKINETFRVESAIERSLERMLASCAWFFGERVFVFFFFSCFCWFESSMDRQDETFKAIFNGKQISPLRC